MGLLNRLKFKAKFFIAKRIMEPNKIKFEIRSLIKGNRKPHPELGEPIDLMGKAHIHPYLTTFCPYKCHYCQNLFYIPTHIKIQTRTPGEWSNLLNRFYNFNHIDFQGGEPGTYFGGNGLIEVINKLVYHNIVVFTHNPPMIADRWNEIDVRTNNIMIYTTYHHLQEEKHNRTVKQFIRDFKKIPKRLKPVASMVLCPEVSYKNIRAEFAAEGIYLVPSDGIMPTKNNKVIDKNKKVLCKNSMVTISPDMKVYHCPGLMFRQIGGENPLDYDFSKEYKECNHYGLCGPIATSKDIKNVSD